MRKHSEKRPGRRKAAVLPPATPFPTLRAGSPRYKHRHVPKRAYGTIVLRRLIGEQRKERGYAKGEPEHPAL